MDVECFDDVAEGPGSSGGSERETDGGSGIGEECGGFHVAVC